MKANNSDMKGKFESRDGYLLATVSGRVSSKQAIQSYEKACDVAAQRGFNKILVDLLAVEDGLSDMEKYELGRTMAEYCLSRSINPKVATVGKLPSMDGFAVQVANNRGLMAQMFSDLQPALCWLNGYGSKATA